MKLQVGEDRMTLQSIKRLETKREAEEKIKKLYHKIGRRFIYLIDDENRSSWLVGFSEDGKRRRVRVEKEVLCVISASTKKELRKGRKKNETSYD